VPRRRRPDDAALVLPGDWVVVGSLPAGPSGTLPNVNPAGCLIVLNTAGKPVETWSNQDINGPWDMTEVATKSGADAAFVLAPTGLALSPGGTLYVAQTPTNRTTAISMQ
jgi:sugar lactone lactonase YvrE